MSPEPRPLQSFEDTFSRGVIRLRSRLALVAVVTLVVLTALALLLAWRQYTEGKSEAARDLQGRAVLAATVFDTFFAGQLDSLNAIAASPSVVRSDLPAMREYFRRIEPVDTQFTGGLGWIDLEGMPRARSAPSSTTTYNVSDRSYFRYVVETGNPFISEALLTRSAVPRRVIVTGVPTRDARGQLTGVLTGAFLITDSTDPQQADALGFEGLTILDRHGKQLSLPTLAKPANIALFDELQTMREGVSSGIRGLSGDTGHVVAYATSTAPSWKVVIDQPASAVFAPARRTLVLEIVAIAVAAAVALGLIGWVLRRSRRQLIADRAEVSRWASLTRGLGSAARTDEVCGLLASSLAGSFPNALVVVALAGEDGLEVRAVEAGRLWMRPTTDDIVLELATLAQGKDDTALTDARQIERAASEEGAPPGARSLYGLVLRDTEQQPTGVVAVACATDEGLDDVGISLVRAHADQASQALARVRQSQHEHDTTMLLQRSLLPEIPAIDGLEIAAQYHAGSADVEVGGDWYDVVRRQDGVVVLMAGDVAGRGLPAAVLMGQLRNASRAYALEHRSPVAIVERVSRHLAATEMATMACVVLDPYTRELAYASAGHPPPLLVDESSGTVARLDGRGRPPLGWRSVEQVDDRAVELPERVTIALYTDGLVERRGSPIDDGIDRLGSFVVRRASLNGDAPAAAVVAALDEPGLDDDAALLLVGFEGVPAELAIEIPADPAVLLDLRRRVGAWLGLRHIGETEERDAILALSEACNNAIEHGYGHAEGTIRIELAHRAETLEIVVSDDGTWREPVADITRGRGLLIIRNVMDEIDLTHTSRGTRVALRQRLSPQSLASGSAAHR